MNRGRLFWPCGGALLAGMFAVAQVSVSTEGFERWYLGNDQADIYVQDLSSGEERRITNTVMVEEYPDLSPDGRRIVFSGYRAGIETNHDLYMVNYDGSDLTQLTYTPDVFEQHPAWSHDGSQIAFVAKPGKDPKEQLYVMTVATRRVSQITFSDSAHASPDWSPDGNLIAFVDIDRESKPVSTEIAIIDVHTGIETRLTNHGANRGAARDPEWSPDGTQIIHIVSVYDVTTGVHYAPYIVDRFGGEPQRLRTDLSLQHPAWSPDGRRIAFMNVRYPEQARIVMMNSDGSNLQTLSNIRSPAHPLWSPDGSRILYVSWRSDPNARSLGSIIVYEDGRIYTTAEPNDLPPLSYATRPLGYAPGDKRWTYTELTVDEYLELYREIKRNTRK